MQEDEDKPRDLDAEKDQETGQKRRRLNANGEAKRRREAFETVMGTEAGRLVLWDVLSMLGTFQTPLVPGAQDLTYANIGRQNAGLELMSTLNTISPGSFRLMQKENTK